MSRIARVVPGLPHHVTQQGNRGRACGRSSTERRRFADFLEVEADQDAFGPLRRSELLGCPLGSAAFIAGIEKRLGRALPSGKRGRKPRKQGALAGTIR